MPNNNAVLRQAKTEKNDEFYTQLADIEKEMKYYHNEFEGKIVYCNCDDCYNSNFVKFFINHFNELKIKRLVSTCYCNSYNGKPYKLVMDKDGQNITILNGNGDFRSRECLELLKECDVVVTNPPFSLFRDFVSTLMKYEKKFLILGNINAVTCKEIFPLIKDNRMWLSNGFSGNVGFFSSPYEDRAVSPQHKEGLIRVSGVTWFTNIDTKERYARQLVLQKAYIEEKYLKYENADAINVDKVKDIPSDYWGVMGVPITFLDKYNPEQFEIIGIDKEFTKNHKRGMINGKQLYVRIFIKKKKII